jgi:hypothetical protein
VKGDRDCTTAILIIAPRAACLPSASHSRSEPSLACSLNVRCLVRSCRSRDVQRMTAKSKMQRLKRLVRQTGQRHFSESTFRTSHDDDWALFHRSNRFDPDRACRCLLRPCGVITARPERFGIGGRELRRFPERSPLVRIRHLHQPNAGRPAIHAQDVCGTQLGPHPAGRTERSTAPGMIAHRMMPSRNAPAAAPQIQRHCMRAVSADATTASSALAACC